MIQPHELRKGNYITDVWAQPGSMFKVKYIQRSCTYGNDFKAAYENLLPVQLSEPILLKAGFIKHTDDELSWFELPVEIYGLDIYTGDKNGFLEVVISFHDEELKRVQYLHHLQNLVLDLTDKELIFEL